MSKTRHNNTGNSDENCGNRQEKQKQMSMSATEFCEIIPLSKV